MTYFSLLKTNFHCHSLRSHLSLATAIRHFIYMFTYLTFGVTRSFSYLNFIYGDYSTARKCHGVCVFNELWCVFGKSWKDTCKSPKCEASRNPQRCSSNRVFATILLALMSQFLCRNFI